MSEQKPSSDYQSLLDLQKTQSSVDSGSASVSPGANIKSIADWVGGAANTVGDFVNPGLSNVVKNYPGYIKDVYANRASANNPNRQSLSDIQKAHNETPMNDVLTDTLPFIVGPAEQGANWLGKGANLFEKYGIPGLVSGFAQGNDTSGSDRIGNAALNAVTRTGIGGLSEAAMNWLGETFGKMGISPQTSGSQSVGKGDQAAQTALDLTKNDLGGGPVSPGGISKAIMGTPDIPETPTSPGIPGQSGVMDKINGQIGDLLSQTSEKLHAE